MKVLIYSRSNPQIRQQYDCKEVTEQGKWINLEFDTGPILSYDLTRYSAEDENGVLWGATA